MSRATLWEYTTNPDDTLETILEKINKPDDLKFKLDIYFIHREYKGKVSLDGRYKIDTSDFSVTFPWGSYNQESDKALRNLSVVSETYAKLSEQDQKIIGAIGVFGPMRINYARIVPLVDYTSKIIGRMLS